MIIKRITAVIFAFFLTVGMLFAQGGLSSTDLKSIDIDKVSDVEIKEYYQKALQAGLDETRLLEMAKARGLDNSQIDKLRLRIQGLNLSSTSPGNPPLSGATKDPGAIKTDRSFNNEMGSDKMQAHSYNPRVFGSELFSGTSTTFEPNIRIATPTGYIIGPDDELIINVFGYSEKTYRQVVNAEGNIYLENVGPVLVNGFSIEEAEARIREKLATTIYKAIRSGQTKVQLRLGNIRSMRITVIGEARKPGTYTVSSLTTLFNALYLCGGPSDRGSFRNIELVRGNKVIRKVDLYQFLSSGDRQDNILLQEQDVIRIPYYETRAILSGEIKRPGIYEIVKGENFDRLFDYSGRFTDSAFRKSVTIYQIDDSSRRVKDLLASQFSTYEPKIGDSIVVHLLLNNYANRVIIKGAVNRPGTYELTTGLDLLSLIQKAGGLQADAFRTGGTIFRLGKDLGPETVSFNLEKVFQNQQRIPLYREDEIMISSIFDLQANHVVEIDGKVSRPGKFNWRKNLSLRDLIVMAGGIAESGSTVDVEIARRLRNAEVKDHVFKQTDIIRLNVGKELEGPGAEFKLEPYDLVIIRPMPGYQQQRTVFIEGPVLKAGRYSLQNSGERISDLIKRAGGFTSTADSNLVFIRRFIGTGLDQQQRKELITRLTQVSGDSIFQNSRLASELEKNTTSLSVNLAHAMENPGGNEDLLLEDGDYVLVSRNSSLVKVTGEVYFPTMIPYEKGKNLKYYVRRTGDFTNMARKNQSFVIYPDGNAESVKKFLFIKSYPSVTPRSEIFVPSKANRNKAGMSTGEWVALSSILATLSTLIVTLLRNP